MLYWTEEEIKILRQWYKRETIIQVAKRIGRSPRSVQQKAISIGLQKNVRGKTMRNLGPEQVTEWVDSYSKIHAKACELCEQGVPIEIRSRWVDVKTANRHEEVAVFCIYPRNIHRYCEEHGLDVNEIKLVERSGG